MSELSHPFEDVTKRFYSTNDHFFAGTRKAQENLFNASMRTINVFPILSYVPNWMPDTQWNRTAREWKVQQDWLVNSVYQWAKGQFAKGTDKRSIMRSIFGREVVTQWSAISGPDAARSELDTEGYVVAPGSSYGAMSRDENVYKDAETFNADRFLDPKVPALPVLGWDRRKCPGNHYGEASVFISDVSLLASYTISGRRDENGQEIVPKIELARNALALHVPEPPTVVETLT
ncbi:hypothetical protein FRC06_004530 [Ceratobasidium sp. 370]|nr:hypothetical protein FRC06_004530 [Ceratobasidium sp. 370]